MSQVIVDPTRATGGVTVQLENCFGVRRRTTAGFCSAGNPCAHAVDAIVGYRYLNMTRAAERSPRTSSAFPAPAMTGIPGGRGDGDRSVPDREQLQRRADRAGRRTAAAGGGRSTAGRRWRSANLRRDRRDQRRRRSLVTGERNDIRRPAGGLLAMPGANIGKFSDNVFAVVPEVGVNVGYQLTQPAAGLRRVQLPVHGQRAAARVT